ncbi:sugar transferase [Ruminococcus flavefaciens]|uniref:sugar transferase n=1 Tax=Ruminococcus flavefaciens TaxID=1265 RepID=UPI0026EDBA53|nr:sugar transferase [Ruminococcus flavefaciens]
MSTIVKERELQTFDSETYAELLTQKRSIMYRIIKRIFDFVASLCVALIILIPCAFIALIISLKDYGSPFYKQKRVGKYAEPLYIWKFRSMKKGADNLEDMLTPAQLEEYKKEYKLDDDPRLIGYRKPGDSKKCFGGVIRSMSIDELPQIIFNICILGNMSVIGPRPVLDSELAENYTPAERKAILSVKPGLTGYWQAYARNDVGYEDHKRQDMELYYVKNQSILLDIKILFKTVFSVLKKQGAK